MLIKIEVYISMLHIYFKTEGHSLWVLIIRNLLVFSKFWINGLKENFLFILQFLHLVGLEGWVNKWLCIYTGIFNKCVEGFYRGAIVMKVWSIAGTSWSLKQLKWIFWWLFFRKVSMTKTSILLKQMLSWS